MAIKDIQQQLIKSEGQSGEFLIKKIKADLDEVYKRGYGDETSPLLDSYWDQALKEFSDEASRAVKKGKSKEAKEVLKDLEVFQKSLEATEEISGSGIAAGTLAMLQAVKPHIEKRAKTLSKNEGIFKSMKKKAIGSAIGAVESFASGFLAPLPFGAGEAIIEKTKGFLGIGKEDKAERQTEQAVSFAGRIERGGGEVAGAGGNGVAEDIVEDVTKETAKANGGASTTLRRRSGDLANIPTAGEEMGGIVATNGNGGGLVETNEILRDILKALKPDRETAREEEREDDREHKEHMDALKAGGGIGAADLAGLDLGGGGGSGFFGNLLGSFLGTKNLKGLLSKKVLARFALIPMLASLGPLLTNPFVLAAVAAGGLAWWLMSNTKGGREGPITEGEIKDVGEYKKKMTKPMTDLQQQYGPKTEGMLPGETFYQAMERKRKEREEGGVASHAEGVTDVEQTHYAKIHKGETVLDNKASKDFKTGLETLEYLQANLGAELMELQKGTQEKTSIENLKKQGLIGTMFIPSKYQDAFHALGEEGSKWSKGISELGDIFGVIHSGLAFHRLMGIDASYEQAESTYGKKHGGLYLKQGFGMSKDEEFLQRAMFELGIDFRGGKSRGKYGGTEGDKGIFQAKENMEGFSLSELLDLKFAVKKYMSIRETIGDPLAASGRLKKGIEGGEVLKPELVKTRAAVQNIVGGKMFHDPTGGGHGDKRGASWEIAPGIEDPAKTFGFNPKIQSIEFLKEYYPPMLWHKILPQSDDYPSYMKKKVGIAEWDYMNKDKWNLPSGKYGMGVAKGGLGLLHKGEEVLEKAEVATIAQALAGNQLNNAAFDRVGLNGQGVVINAPTVNAPTSVSNNTITPKRLPSPNFGGRVGEGDKFLS